MELSKELLQKQIEILLHAIENGKIDDRNYYPTLYLDDLINMAENSEESGYNVERMVAASAIKYPDLHNLIRNLVQQITTFNLKAWDNYDDFWLLHANDMDYAGAAYAKELAIANQNDIQTYIDFYLTNDVNHEVYQGKDIEAILEKWGVNEITYPLIVARWFEPGQHGDEQLEEYFDSMVEKFTDSAQCDLFIKACANWFLKLVQKNNHEIDEDDKTMINRLFSSLFDEVEHFEDYIDEHENDEDFDEDNIYGYVINKFCDYIEKGELPTYSNLL